MLGNSSDSMMSKLRQKGIRSKVSLAQAVGLASFDCIATFVSYVVAAWGTTEWTLTVSHIGSFAAIGALALITVCVYAACGMYSCLWRYASIFECLRIALASIAAAVVADVVFAVLLQAQLSLRTYVLAWAILLIGTAVGILDQIHPMRLAPNPFGTAWGSCNPGRS